MICEDLHTRQLCPKYNISTHYAPPVPSISAEVRLNVLAQLLKRQKPLLVFK